MSSVTPFTDEGTEAPRGHTGNPGAPALRALLAVLRACKAHFSLNTCFHLVAVDKQRTMDSRYGSELPHTAQPALLIIP